MESTEPRLLREMDKRMKKTGEWKYTKWPRPDHPPFRGAACAATRLLDLLGPGVRILCMRDQCLGPLRELALVHGYTLLIPSKDGQMVYRIPENALQGVSLSRSIPLRVEPLPPGTRRYSGGVDVVVVGCLGFDARRPRLYSYDMDRTAGILEGLREGTANGFRLAEDVPVVCLAADCQEVRDWPDDALGYVRAAAVVTPTRTVVLGEGCGSPC
jgi:5-formyltetrahydrofolate cyclo-ligase